VADSTEIVLDGSTGLPVLPEGYIWHVAPGNVYTSWKVRIMEKGKEPNFWERLWGEEQGWVVIEEFSGGSNPITEENVLSISKTLYGLWDRRRKRKELEDSLTGFYPPNSLNRQ
jgi:hypothetical protein